ncbi:MAG: TonB C-terminal domain-containing protein [Candidatus Aminicenantes bacterium]|nr:TonB C-terminal domain-containing protein [Candidatus Aminicenantes bacterium]
MKFRSAIITSFLFHLALVLVAFFYPENTITNETTYYVDLVQVGGSPPGSSKNSAKKGNEIIEKSVSVKDLSVKKEKKPELTYPDKASKKRSPKKKKDSELVSVIKRKKPVTNIEQSPDTSESDEGGYVKTGLSGSGTGAGGPGGSFPYSYYVETLKSKITSNWYNPLSSSGNSGKFLSIVYFRIFRNGTIGKVKLIKKSGNKYYDLSTLRVIKEVVPFPPLPSDYPELYLGVYFEFEWER